MDIEYKPIPINEYSRPGRGVECVKAIVLHWVGNAGQSSDEVRSFFELRKYGRMGYGSAQFIVGLEGTVLQIMPEDEVAYHSGATEYTEYARKKFGKYATRSSSPNNCTIGIEMCHVGWDGFTTANTVDSTRSLCRVLIARYGLSPLDVTMHYNITRKRDDNGPCPKWYVEHPEDFQLFIEMLRRG